MDLLAQSPALTGLALLALDRAVYQRYTDKAVATPLLLLRNTQGDVSLQLLDPEQDDLLEDVFRIAGEADCAQFALAAEGVVDAAGGGEQDAMLVYAFSRNHAQGQVCCYPIDLLPDGSCRLLGGMVPLAPVDMPLPLLQESAPELAPKVELQFPDRAGLQDCLLHLSDAHVSALIAHTVLFLSRLFDRNTQSPLLSGEVVMQISLTAPALNEPEFVCAMLQLHAQRLEQVVQPWCNFTGQDFRLVCSLEGEESVCWRCAPQPKEQVQVPDLQAMPDAQLDIACAWLALLPQPKSRHNPWVLAHLQGLFQEYRRRGLAMPHERGKASKVTLGKGGSWHPSA